MSTTSLQRRDAIAVLTTTLGLGGCIPAIPGLLAEPRTFRVTPKYTFAEDLPSVSWSLAVVTGGIAVDYVALAFWIDRAPSMLQTLIVQSFRNSGRIEQVGTTRDRLRPDFLLTSDLRTFQLNRGNGPEVVRVRLDVQLLRMPQRNPIGSQSLSADWTPTGGGIDPVVAAFDEATGKVLKDLVAWTLRTGQRSMR